jgi:hypothetical protein
MTRLSCPHAVFAVLCTVCLIPGKAWLRALSAGHRFSTAAIRQSGVTIKES